MRETERGSLIDCGDAEIGVTSAHWWKYKVPCGIEAVLRNAKEKTLLQNLYKPKRPAQQSTPEE